MLAPARKIKVLIVDDSAIVRKILSDTLLGERDIEVVGTAPDPYIARDKIVALRPDVLTLDVEMPRMDGLTFLKKLMRAHPLPVIMISSLTQSSSAAAVEALAEGAVEVLAKPSGPYSVGEFRSSLAAKVRAAAAARPAKRLDPSARPLAKPGSRGTPPAPASTSVSLIALGASTGGTEAIERILTELPAEMPPIAIVQHIPAGFSRAFASRLDRICRLSVKEAADGDKLVAGQALIAPGDYHMRVRRGGGSLCVVLDQSERVCYQRPSVDVMFTSIAENAGKGVVAALLTGMGVDGARGLLALRSSGARSLAQDEASSVVFGMPKEAIRLGAVCEVLPLHRIAAHLIGLSFSRRGVIGSSD